MHDNSMKTITVMIHSETFGAQLADLRRQLALEAGPIHLDLQSLNTPEDVKKLEEFIQANRNELPFKKLSVSIAPELIPTCQSIVAALCDTTLYSLELVLPSTAFEEASKQKTHDELIQEISGRVNYPLFISQRLAPDHTARYEDQEFRELFDEIVIHCIQEKQQTEQIPAHPEQGVSTEAAQSAEGDVTEIRLKKLIRENTLKTENLEHYIPLELQHVEVVEQVIEQEIEEEINVEAQLEAHALGRYADRQLIGYAEFRQEPYSSIVASKCPDEAARVTLYKLIQQEFFANLPHAIKFLSPEAAAQLAYYLPGLSTLNIDNLPPGFVLKDTDQGEIVLDYDVTLEDVKTNVFTPVPYVESDEIEPLYQVRVPEALVQVFPGCQATQLVNLWIRHGEQGVKEFDKCIKVCPPEQQTLIRQYLSNFPQWDHFLDNKNFSESLVIISNYHKDQEKFKCFKKFLKNTGSSRHDLSKTVAAFEVFWAELTHLCRKHQVDIKQINAKQWATPQGGNPVVYMERLFLILRNARNLQEQLDCLDSPTLVEVSRRQRKHGPIAGLVLTNYGAYYASKFEAFKVVSPAMKLTYDRKTQDELPFDQNYQLYRVDLDTLCDVVVKQPDARKAEAAAAADTVHASIPDEAYYAKVYRFAGQQPAGIAISSFVQQFQDFIKTHDPSLSFQEHLLCLLFFVSHERFVSDKPLLGLIEGIKTAQGSREVILKALEKLRQLYRRDIKLSNEEGQVIFQLIANMNSAGFEQRGLSKEDSIQKLFVQLEKNKHSALKLLKFRSKNPKSPHPFLYAFDTEAFLKTDPHVVEVYRDDLLLFSELINGCVASPNSVVRDPGSIPYVAATATDSQGVTLTAVQAYLKKSAEQPAPNNLQYAIKRMIQSNEYFSYARFLDACKEIDALTEFDPKQVDPILEQFGFKRNDDFLAITARDNDELKNLLMKFIVTLEAMKAEPPLPVESFYEFLENEASGTERYTALKELRMRELIPILNQAWIAVGPLLSVFGVGLLQKILKDLKTSLMKDAFSSETHQDFLNIISEKVSSIKTFQACDDFDAVNRIVAETENLARLFKQMTEHPFFDAQKQELLTVFNEIDFSKVEYACLYALLSVLVEMPQRNYLGILKAIVEKPAILSDQETLGALIDQIRLMHTNNFPSSYIERCIQLFHEKPDDRNFTMIIQGVIQVYAADQEDSLLKWILSTPSMTYEKVHQLIECTQAITENRDKLKEYLAALQAKNALDKMLKKLQDKENEAPGSRQALLGILAMGHAIKTLKAGKKKDFNEDALIALLIKLSKEELDRLHTFYQRTPANLACLQNALETRAQTQDFAAFLESFEKAPFGKRDEKAQFDCSQVERVVNQSANVRNHSQHSYRHRKQLMEAFLFVNEIGSVLPIYKGKTARDLSNAEILQCFQDIKSKKFGNLSPFQNRLLALGLMREAMYRSTGQFPYSTQMLAIIDCMMHEGDVIAQIDTGQGKSLMDVMKAVILSLDSDRVDITTSSLVDSKRDIANYGPFLQSLGIEYSHTPITASSQDADFKQTGINFSTFSHFSLFFAKAKAKGMALEDPESVSLIVNESDHSLLDDTTIYRYATSSGVGFGQEWIYDAINQFVMDPKFTDRKTNQRQDIASLREYLISKARENKKSSKIIHRFDDKQLLGWINSALIVNYKFRENYDYVIAEDTEDKIIHGVMRHTRAVKVLMKDGKISPDLKFGDGLQQLLCARLNAELKRDGKAAEFVIEPETKTIISSNNKNLMEYYRSKKGFIWGSSGTIGADLEIQRQYQKYGFEFSKIEPHQKKRVKQFEPIIAESEEQQFEMIAAQLRLAKKSKMRPPCLVFCKDIETAKRLHAFLKKQGLDAQCYTGMGNEEQVIATAAQPGCITITTPALGRNTDIPYDKMVGLRVWHTAVDATRWEQQRSGRTGRQGSPGQVRYVLNQQDLRGKDPDVVRGEIDDGLSADQASLEEIYDLIGYLLQTVTQIPPEHFSKTKGEFIQANWSSFSEACEKEYREEKQAQRYDQSKFVERKVAEFNRLLQGELRDTVPGITADAVLAFMNDRYADADPVSAIVYSKSVRLSDCTAPATIAYHALGFKDKDLDDTKKEETKKQVSQLLQELEQGNATVAHARYLKYLKETPMRQQALTDIHKDCLTQFLAENSKRRSLIQRVFCKGKLHQIANNKHYLLFFHACVSVSKKDTIVKLDDLKKTLNALLNEYLSHGWFLNADRKKEAKALKTAINGADDVKAIIAALSATQIKVATQDIQTNKDSFWRRHVKPLNFSGKSRLQETVDQAFCLTDALTSQNLTDEAMKAHITELNKKIVEVGPTVKEEASLDEFKQALTTAASEDKKKDKANLSVLDKSLTSMHDAHHLKHEPDGMKARKPKKPSA